MHRAFAASGAAAIALFLSSLAACGAKHSAAAFEQADAAVEPGATPPDAGVDSALILSSDGSATDPAIPCSGPHCSSDLHTLVDCDGTVLKTCPADQGCTLNGCVPACQSAQDNKSSLGCDYYAVDPDVIVGVTGACYAAFVANTWSTPVVLTVDFAGMSLDPATFAYIPSGTGQSTTYKPLSGGMIPAGQVAILFLDKAPGGLPLPPGMNLDCPKGVKAAITTSDAATHGTGLGSAFHISASAPVVAYDVYPYGGGQSALTSSTLLLPTSAWGTNYVAVDPFGSDPFNQPFIELVAQQDGTTITINPVATITGGSGVTPTAKGIARSYTVNSGQVLQFTQADSLAGSVVQSTSPIGLWGGQTALGIGQCCLDTGHQQIPPVAAFGSEYAAVRYRNRYEGVEESPPWRLVGAAKGTVLTYEPKAPSGAPTTLDLGEVVEFSTNGPFVIKSQDAKHPFYFGAHMTGAGQFDTTMMDGRGDPEFVNVVPPAEYLSAYVFFTDPTYPETDLVVVRARGSHGFDPVTLDCAGALTGWAPVGTSGKYEYTRFDLVRGNFVPQGKCNNGRHEMSSSSPFGVTVWGWGSGQTGEIGGTGFYSQYVSYAYPAGAGFAPINAVVVPTTPQ